MRHIPSMFFEILNKISKNIIDCTFGLGNYFFIKKLNKKVLFSFEKDIKHYKFSKLNTKNKNFTNLNKIISRKNSNIDIFSDLGISINQINKNILFFSNTQRFLLKSIKVLKGNGKIIILCFNYNDYSNIIHFKNTFGFFIGKSVNIKSKEIDIKKNQCSRCAKLIIMEVK